MIQNLTAVFLLAFLTESLVEYFFAPLLKGINNSNSLKAVDYLKYISAVVGVVLCLIYSVDVLAELAGLIPVHPVVGQIVTGIIIGRGGNILNDIVDLTRSHSRTLSKYDRVTR